MIEIRNLTKTYGAVTAVDDLTVTIRPGKVTGFLGPNGAGKSTTMRAIVGLDRPDAGDVLIGGRRYADDPAPLHTVGALLDARAFHPGRSARAHLQALAATQEAGTAWTRCSTWWGCATSPTGARAASPSAWGSGWGSRRHCSATPRF